MSQDLSKGKIYKITNDYNDEVYVGSTCDTLIKRFSCHKSHSNNPKKMNRPLYALMREIGTERFAIYLIEEFSCVNKYELNQREGHWIRQIGNLNKRIEGRTKSEYREHNSDKFKIYSKQYNEENVEKLTEYRKKYYRENADKIIEYSKKYFQENFDKIKENRKEYLTEYYQKTKAQLSEVVECDCGCKVSKYSLTRHKKRQIHIKRMEEQKSI
jgi:hypothetical protein